MSLAIIICVKKYIIDNYWEYEYKLKSIITLYDDKNINALKYN